MAERKRLVLDAKILIRACLGVRARVSMADLVHEVDFSVAGANAAEAAADIGELASEQGHDPHICQEAQRSRSEAVRRNSEFHHSLSNLQKLSRRS